MNDQFDESPDPGLESKLMIRERSIGSSRLDGKGNVEYLLIKVIGESGLSVVWHAIQVSAGRDLAIKMIRGQDSLKQKSRDMFLRQTLITADLDHPNIVPVYDLCRSESNELFCSMRIYQGERWDKLIGSKTLEENLEIWLKVAEAIAFAHFRGVVHRDIKPARVVVGSFGEVQLTDFGHAMVLPNFRHYALLHEQSKCRDGMTGTPAYMAPEQAAGEYHKIGPWSDVYLLGATLFEMIVGVPPHLSEADNGRLNVMRVLQNALSNKIVQTNISNELLDIALKAIKTSPGDRYPSAKDLINAVKGYITRHTSF